MDIIIDGMRLSPELKNGRYVYTFTAPRDAPSVELSSDCLGDLELSEIQVEKNSAMTYFVPPEVYSGDIKGLFKDVKAIQLGLSDDTNEGLWGEIKLTAQGMIERYHNDHVSTEILNTAEGIKESLEDSLSSLSTEITKTAEGIDEKIQNQAGDFSKLSSRVDGIVREISNPDGSVNSRIIQLRELIEQSVTKDGLRSVIQNSGDAIAIALTKQGSDIINAINLTRDGTKITGNIHLDGATFTRDFTAEIAKILELSANRITSGELDASNVRITNLDVKTVNGLNATFISAIMDQAIVKLLQGKVIAAQNGAMTINLNNAGIVFNQNATFEFNSSNNAMYRKRGTNTGFLHFVDESHGGVYAGLGVTSSGDGINSRSSGRFSGIRIFRTAKGGMYSTQHEAEIDQIEIYGDTVHFKDDFGLNRGVVLETSTMVDYVNIAQWLSQFNQNFKHIINIIGRGDVIKTFNHAWLQSELDKWNIR